MGPKDEELDELVGRPWDEIPHHYQRTILRRAKSDQWWDELLERIRRNQMLYITIVAALGAVGALREQLSEAAQWLAHVLNKE